MSIVVPAYNEQAVIRRTVESLVKFFGNPHTEVIVVASGTDDTAEEALSVGSRCVRVLKSSEKGKGKAVRLGLAEAKGESIVMADADLSCSPEEIDRLVSFLDSYDVAIGSRALPGSVLTIAQPFRRRLAGRVFSCYVNLLFRLGIKDTQCGFKAFRSEVVKKVLPSLTADGWEFDVDLLHKIKAAGFTVVEVPVVWRNAPSKLSLFRDSFRMFVGVTRLWWRS